MMISDAQNLLPRSLPPRPGDAEGQLIAFGLDIEKPIRRSTRDELARALRLIGQKLREASDDPEKIPGAFAEIAGIMQSVNL